MASCTFFGHRHCPASVYELIRIHLIGIIENEDVDTFYVGNQGDFDAMVLKVLRELSSEYPHICYIVMLAYHPISKRVNGVRENETVFPEGLDKVYPRFAIEKRNRHMHEISDYVMTYAKTAGGAMKFTELAEKMGKQVINLAELE